MLMCSKQLYHIKALALNEKLQFVEDYNVFSVTFRRVIYDIFVRTFKLKSIFVGPFWTIRYELLGSVLVYFLAWYANNLKKRQKLFYVGVIMLFRIWLPSEYRSFVYGAFVFECVYRWQKDVSILGRIVDCIRKSRMCFLLQWIIGIYLCTCNLTFSGMYAPLNAFANGGLIRASGCAILLYCIVNSKSAQQVFSFRLFVDLGKISQYVYAFHWPIILSIGCGLYIVLYNIPYVLAVWIISVVVIFATCVISAIYTSILPNIIILEKRLGRKAVECFKRINPW